MQRLVIDCGGVGYDVQAPLSTMYTVGESGTPVSLRIHTHVREDAIQLFGFATSLELQLFERLIAVNGIGPRLALSVLSGIESAELVRAVRDSDVARLTTIPGVGKKTAERIVIELRDRISSAVLAAGDATALPAGDDLRGDLLSALGNLGYQRAGVEKVVGRILDKAGSREFDVVLREVLRELTR